MLAAGCGGGDDEGAPTATTRTALTITLDSDGSGVQPLQRTTLACPGDSANVCDAAQRLSIDAAAPVPADARCTEIYGGPDVVTIAGMLNGAAIDTQLTRTNGCEVERFGRFAPLLAELFPEYRPGASLEP